VALAFFGDSNPISGTGSVTPEGDAGTGWSGGTILEGDHAFITVSYKHAGATVATPAGWVLIASAAVGTGTEGAGTGPIQLRVYYRQVPSGGLTLPTLTMGGDSTGRVVQAALVVYRGALGAAGRITFASTSGSDTTSDTDLSIAGAANVGIQTGDALLCFGAVTDDSSTTLSAQALSTAGVTYGSTGNPFNTGSGDGDDVRSFASRAIATSGPSTGAPVFNATLGAASTGGALFLRLREMAVETRRFYLANAAPAFAPGTAASFWNDTSPGLTTPHRLAETPEGASASTQDTETAAAAGWFVLLGQWISAPASAAGAISGLTYGVAAGWVESDAAADLAPVIYVKVIDGATGALRDEAISQFSSGRELPTGTPAAISFTASDGRTADFLAGDRIVLELGFRTGNAVTTSYSGTLYYGGTGSPDLADGVTDLSRPGWVDLVMTSGIVFEETGTTVPLGRPGETSSARAVTAAKQRQLGSAASSDAARALAPGKASALGSIAETDGTRPLAAGRVAALGQATEAAGARPLAAAKSTTLGVAGTLSAARALTSERAATLTAVGETSGAGHLVENRGLVAAAETSSARELASGKIYALGRVGDTAGTRALNTHELGRPSTLEGQRPWTAAKQAGLAPATDLGHARQLLPGKTYVLGRAGDNSRTRELSSTAFARAALTLALWAVDPDDGHLIPLPHRTKLSVSPTRNSPGEITVEYPAHGRNAYLLRELADDDRDLEVEIWLHGSREGALRGLLSASSSDDTDEHAVNGYTGTLLEQLLDEVLLGPQETDEKKELAFAAANGGEMVATVLQLVQARGCLVGVTRDFTTDEDSTATPWPTTTTVKFSPTATFLEMLQELVELGMLDAFELTADRVLRLWGPGQYGVDRTVGERPLTFRRGRDLTEAPLRHNVRPAGTTVLAAGAEGHYRWATDPTALARRGRRIEVATTANALKDAAAVEAFAQQSLPTATTGTREVAHSLVVGPGRARPRKDFERGDWVRSDTAGRIERRRIWQWTLVEDVSGLHGELVVGTPVTDHLQALARQLKRISSGAAVVGTSEPPPADDAVPPAAPTGLVAESKAYQDPTQPMGFTLAEVTLGWAPVTTNAEGANAPKVQAAQAILDRFVAEQPIAADWTWEGAPPVVYAHREELRAAWEAAPGEPTAQQWLQSYIDANTGVPTAADDVAGYRVRWAELGLGQVGGIPSSDPFPESNLSYYEATPAEGTTDTSWTWTGAPAGANLRLEVQAFDKSGNHGPWAAIGHDTAVDDKAPPTPSGAVGLKTVRTTLDVPWDGFGAEGEPMPTDFSHVRIWLSQAAAFTVPAEVDSEPTPFDPQLAEPQYVDRLYTGGTTNIVGLPYGVGWYAALQAVDHSGNASELSAIVGPVTATQLVQIDIGPDAIGRQQIIDLEVVRAAIANLSVNSAKVEEISAGLVTTGTLLATLTMTGAIQTASTGLRWRGDPAGIRFYNSNNELTIDLRGDSGNVLMTGQIQSALAGARWVMTKEGTLRLYPPSGNNFSEIANRGNDVVWRGPLTNGRSGRVNVNTQGAAINYSAEEDLLENIRAEILVVDRQLRLTAPFINLIVDRRWTSPVGGLVSGRRIQFSHIDDDGDFIERSGVSYITDSDGDGGMVGNDVGWKFERNSNGDGRFMLTNGNMTNWGVGQALAWDGPSSREVKKDIADARAVLDPKATIGAARARKFRYNQQRPDEDPYIGVIAEELPEVLQRPMKAPDGTDVIGTDYGSMIGVLWGFANQILDQEIVSTSGTVVLPRSQLGPGGIFPAGATVELPVSWDSTPPAAPTGGFVQLHSSFVWAGRVTAWIKTGTVDQHGATVVFKNISTSNVVVNEATDALRVSATVIGLGLFTPPYVPPEEP
jgi:hypothetical protein